MSKKKHCHLKINKAIWIKRDIDDIFEFFMEAKNLEAITPPWLNFKILNQSTKEITLGTLFNYKLKVHGVPIYWTSIISTWQANNAKEKKFTDHQVKGPYKTWYHTHSFQSVQGGTLMQDQVYYSLPFSPFSDPILYLWVKRDVEKIFKYRNNIIKNRFDS